VIFNRFFNKFSSSKIPYVKSELSIFEISSKISMRSFIRILSHCIRSFYVEKTLIPFLILNSTMGIIHLNSFR